MNKKHFSDIQIKHNQNEDDILRVVFMDKDIDID